MDINEYAGKVLEGRSPGAACPAGMGENTKSPVKTGLFVLCRETEGCILRCYMNAEGLVVGSAVPGFLPWANSKAEVGVISGKYSLNSAIVQSSIFPS